LGVVAALVLAALRRRLTPAMLMAALDGAMRSTGMIMLIVAAAWFLNFVLSALGLIGAINAAIAGLHLGPNGLILTVIALYLVLGMFMDPLAMMIVTVPIIAPLVTSAGFDPVWFGILMVLLCETALVTPPIGMNLFVVQGIRRRGTIDDIIIGVLPFVVCLIVMIGLLLLFPQIALWLPSVLGG
jgi:TRAP-type C4-dicarboxylate transport system permease large subunit